MADPMTIAIAAFAGKTVLTSYGMKEEGKAQRRAAEARYEAADFEAKQMEQRAGQEIAAAQRTGIEDKRIAALVASRAQAVAAASGGGASDVSVVNLISKVKGEGAYRAMVRMYEGESRARSLRLGAAARRYEGATGVIEAARGQKVANTMAFANLIVGGTQAYGMAGSDQGGGLYGKYGGSDAYGGHSGDAGISGMGTFA